MHTVPELAHSSFHIENRSDVIDSVKNLVDGSHPGILCTVDPDGRPQSRWMATLSFDDFPIFHTLASPESRKVRQIKLHPHVNWMFFNDDLSLIVNLAGKARVIEDTKTLKRIWKRIEDKSRAYFLDQYAKGPGFVVIETEVERVECTTPKNALCFSLAPAELSRRRQEETGNNPSKA